MLALLSLIMLLWVFPTILVLRAIWLVRTSRVTDVGLKFSFRKSTWLSILPLVSVYILIVDREVIITMLFE